MTDMWMCFCSIKAKIWHHPIFLMSSLQCVQIISRFSYSFVLLTQPWFLSSTEVLSFWRHEPSWYNSCHAHAEHLHPTQMCVCRCVVLSSWLRELYFSLTAHMLYLQHHGAEHLSPMLNELLGGRNLLSSLTFFFSAGIFLCSFWAGWTFFCLCLIMWVFFHTMHWGYHILWYNYKPDIAYHQREE